MTTKSETDKGMAEAAKWLDAMPDPDHIMCLLLLSLLKVRGAKNTETAIPDDDMHACEAYFEGILGEITRFSLLVKGQLQCKGSGESNVEWTIATVPQRSSEETDG
jgi:hypothetical protein